MISCLFKFQSNQIIEINRVALIQALTLSAPAGYQVQNVTLPSALAAPEFDPSENNFLLNTWKDNLICGSFFSDFTIETYLFKSS